MSTTPLRAQLIEAFYHMSPNALAVFDRDLRVVRLNAAMGRVAGIPDAACTEGRLQDLLPDFAPTLEHAVRMVLDTGRPVLDVPITSRTGEPAELRHSANHFFPIRLAGEVRGVGLVSVDQTARARAEEALTVSENRFRELAEHIDAAFWIVSADYGAVHYVSPGFERVFGRRFEETLHDGRALLEFVHSDDRASTLEAMLAGECFEVEFRVLHPDGSIRWVSNRGFPIRDAEGIPVRRAGIASDITLRKTLESQVRQAQRLDSIGRLAGGIAHDFNNLLTVVLGQATMAAAALDSGQSPKDSVALIQQAAMRAAELTRQLLAFARRQATQPALLDLNDVVRSLEKLLRGLLRDDVELVTSLDADLGIVRVDPTQVEQILVNLAVNGREAMPTGGRLTLESANVEIDASRAAATGLRPGRYCMLSVTDTGRGVPDTARPYVFEPFFTTKHLADGTGLGLSTCYGIVKQHGGYIDFETEVGRGTTFRVYFPRLDAPASASPPAREAEPPRGSERVLVVEDDLLVRSVAVQALRDSGFEVLEAGDGIEALRVIDASSGAINLVVSDVVMPSLDGFELGERLRLARPDLRVIYTSGYIHGSERLAAGIATAKGHFLQKPYLPAALVRHVRDALDQPGGQPG